MRSRALCTLALLGAALGGCGIEAHQQEAPIASTQKDVTLAERTPLESTPETSIIPPWADNGDSAKACCYVWCSDRYTWVGPFTSVPYGSCKSWASYYCSTRDARVKGAKWDDC